MDCSQSDGILLPLYIWFDIFVVCLCRLKLSCFLISSSISAHCSSIHFSFACRIASLIFCCICLYFSKLLFLYVLRLLIRSRMYCVIHRCFFFGDWCPSMTSVVSVMHCLNERQYSWTSAVSVVIERMLSLKCCCTCLLSALFFSFSRSARLIFVHCIDRNLSLIVAVTGLWSDDISGPG